MTGRRTIALLGALAVVAAACSGDGSTGTVPFGSSPTAGGTAATTDGDDGMAVSAEIPGDGGIATLAGGVTIEALPGTFESPTTITVVEGGSAVLPPGVTGFGEPVTITATAEPGVPVLVGLPIPDGVDPDGLFLLRTSDDGTQQILGGFVEGGIYFAATPGFSEFQLVGHALENALTLGTGATAGGVALDLTPQGDAAPDTSLGASLSQEYTGLVKGTIAAPAHRSVRLVGPDEVAVGELGVYSAVDFIALDRRFVQFSWSIFGEGLALSGSGGSGSNLPEIPVTGSKVGRAMLVVEATDPLTGASAFASKRVFVVEDTLTIWAVADKSLYFGEDDEGPKVGLRAIGGTPPYRWVWTWDDGIADTHEGNEFRVSHPPISRDITLVATVTDATDVEASATVGVRGLPGHRFGSSALLAGPTTGAVGDELVFTIMLWEPDMTWTLPPQILVGGAKGSAEVEGDVVRATFDEPGFGVLKLMDNASGLLVEDQALIAAAAVRITGEAPLAEARFGEAPVQTAAGVTTGFTIEARGGIVASGADPSPHSATVDFDDGSVAEVSIPAVSALDWAAAPVVHTWAEGGNYTATLTVTTPDGQTATATMEIEVVSEQRAVGSFNAADSEVLTVVQNSVVVIIEGTTVEFESFVLDTNFQFTQFFIDGAGNEVTVPADCIRVSTIRFQESDVTFAPAQMRLSGTVTVQDKADDEGTECPFGGGHRDVIRVGEVDGTFQDGVVGMTVAFPTIPGAFETTLTVTAAVP